MTTEYEEMVSRALADVQRYDAAAERALRAFRAAVADAGGVWRKRNVLGVGESPAGAPMVDKPSARLVAEAESLPDELRAVAWTAIAAAAVAGIARRIAMSLQQAAADARLLAGFNEEVGA